MDNQQADPRAQLAATHAKMVEDQRLYEIEEAKRPRPRAPRMAGFSPLQNWKLRRFIRAEAHLIDQEAHREWVRAHRERAARRGSVSFAR